MEQFQKIRLEEEQKQILQKSIKNFYGMSNLQKFINFDDLFAKISSDNGEISLSKSETNFLVAGIENDPELDTAIKEELKEKVLGEFKNNLVDTKRSSHLIAQLIKNIEIIIRGRTEVIKLVITAMIADGHILLEDYPGSGKTTLAKTLGHSIASSLEKEGSVGFHRVQFTPDLLPSDILGVNIYNQKDGTFHFSRGPVFTNILLADEINRTSPKVQSALLECMAEKQVTLDNVTYFLDDFFFVIGTQNPLDIAGTYPLPLVQLDRFLMKLDLGHIDRATELDVLSNYKQIRQVGKVKPVCNYDDILYLRDTADKVYADELVLNCIVDIIDETRTSDKIILGASTRSSIMFLRALKAYALVHGRDYIIEDDIRNLAVNVLFHRLRFRDSVKNPKDALDKIVADKVELLVKAKKKRS